MAMGKSLNLSEPQISPLYGGDCNIPGTGLLGRLREVVLLGARPHAVEMQTQGMCE